MDHSDWEIITVLCGEKNLTRAAERLFVTQPSLTYRLKRIERELGATLFERLPSGLIPTVAGERADEYARAMQRLYRDLQDEISTMSAERIGMLRLGVCSAFANTDLPQILLEFRRRCPNVTIQLRSSRSSEICKQLEAGEVSVAIVRGKPVWEGEKRLLREEPMCLVSRESVSIPDLPGIPQIRIPSSGTYHDDVTWWRQNFSVPPLSLMEVDNMETGLELVCQRLGWMILPYIALKRTPGLFYQPLRWNDGTPYTRKTWVLYWKETAKSWVVPAFLELLEEETDSPVVSPEE
ncbi:MAG: LysR family transcriptional regulator [Lawsonibacter sp.]|nr:LysR family transcriptional regulator [Lawsonibacter sp.]